MKKILFIVIIFLAVVFAVIFKIKSQIKFVTNEEKKAQLDENYQLDPDFVMEENTSKSFIKSYNNLREHNMKLVMEALTLYMDDESNNLSGVVTEKPQQIAKRGADLCMYVIPKYISCLPRDTRMLLDKNNKFTGAGFVCDCNTDYQTGFFVSRNSSGQLVMEAPLAEGGEKVSITQ